jgi:hypothetical protein
MQVVDACEYMFEWHTAYACPHKTSVGMIFFWILLSMVSVYFLGGMAYKRWRLGYRGLDQVPHIDFWMKLWDIVRVSKRVAISCSS